MAPLDSCAASGERRSNKGTIITIDMLPKMSNPPQLLSRVKPTRMLSEGAFSTESTVPSTIMDDDDLTETMHVEGDEGQYLSDHDSLSEVPEGDSEQDVGVDYFTDVATSYNPENPTTLSREVSVLKQTSSEMFINYKRATWLQLPKPDLIKIRSLSCPTTPQEKKKAAEGLKKRVSFRSIEMRSYALTLGDNPSVSYGPPISLDWAFEEHGSVDLEEYEANRGQRRTLRQMMLNYYERMNILTFKAGFTEDELKQAQRNANKIKNQRSITRAFLPVSKVEELVQSASRKVRRLSGKKEKK